MDKIFVSIASYRDPEISKTVNDIITKAKNPELLRIVVYEQNGPDDPSIFGVYPVGQVLVLRDHFTLAKGPTYARYIIQKEYRNEEYYLQIDSHMRTINNWDHILKHMLKLVPEPSVLTQYPPEYNKDTDFVDSNTIRSGLYIQGFGPKDRFTRIQSDIIDLKNRRYFPYTSKAWSACFSFSKGNVVLDAPYESIFEYLFFGEELDITLKLFTKGYYFYSPHISVFYTLFKRTGRRTYWEDIPASERAICELKSRNKLHKRIITGNNIYGNVRSINQYMKFSNIDSLSDCKLNKKSKAFRRHTDRPLIK